MLNDQQIAEQVTAEMLPLSAQFHHVEFAKRFFNAKMKEMGFDAVVGEDVPPGMENFALRCAIRQEASAQSRMVDDMIINQLTNERNHLLDCIRVAQETIDRLNNPGRNAPPEVTTWPQTTYCYNCGHQQGPAPCCETDGDENGTTQQMAQEIQKLRARLGAATATISQLVEERADLEALVVSAQQEIDQLKDQEAQFERNANSMLYELATGAELRTQMIETMRQARALLYKATNLGPTVSSSTEWVDKANEAIVHLSFLINTK